MPHINKERFRELFFASPVLVLTAAVMALDLVVCVFGLLFDHTVITGAPVWVKPTKFAVSTGLYALSLVVIIRYTPIWKRTLRTIEFLTGLALMVEILLIDLQAARHTTSHFNVATPFDRNVFITMAVGIGVLWLSSLVLTVATFRTRYGSPSWTLAVRYGMLLAVLGAGTGAFMAAPSRAQRQAARSTHHMTLSGSHPIGGVDGVRDYRCSAGVRSTAMSGWPILQVCMVCRCSRFSCFTCSAAACRRGKPHGWSPSRCSATAASF